MIVEVASVKTLYLKGSIDPVGGLVNGGFLVATPVAW